MIPGHSVAISLPIRSHFWRMRVRKRPQRPMNQLIPGAPLRQNQRRFLAIPGAPRPRSQRNLAIAQPFLAILVMSGVLAES